MPRLFRVPSTRASMLLWLLEGVERQLNAEDVPDWFDDPDGGFTVAVAVFVETDDD